MVPMLVLAVIRHAIDLSNHQGLDTLQERREKREEYSICMLEHVHSLKFPPSINRGLTHSPKTHKEAHKKKKLSTLSYSLVLVA